MSKKKNKAATLTTTSPINHKYEFVRAIDLIRKSKLREWAIIEKEFKKWSNPDEVNCVSYYSPIQILETLEFFKKHFIK